MKCYTVIKLFKADSDQPRLSQLASSIKTFTNQEEAEENAKSLAAGGGTFLIMESKYLFKGEIKVSREYLY